MLNAYVSQWIWWRCCVLPCRVSCLARIIKGVDGCSKKCRLISSTHLQSYSPLWCIQIQLIKHNLSVATSIPRQYSCFITSSHFMYLSCFLFFYLIFCLICINWVNCLSALLFILRYVQSHYIHVLSLYWKKHVTNVPVRTGKKTEKITAI